MQNNPLVESVRALAEAQKAVAKWSPDNETSLARLRRVSELRIALDIPALLKHLERAERDEALLRRALRILSGSNGASVVQARRALLAEIRIRLEPQ